MFTRQDTKALKGAAILFMLLHHLAYTGDRWPLDFPGFVSLIPGFVEKGWLGELALNALVCVPLFFFLGGYGLYKRRQAGSFRLLDAIVGLYRKYWRVFVIFVPIGLLFFAGGTDVLRPFCVRFQFTSAKQLLIDLVGNFTGYKATFNSEWWFFGAYLCVLPLGCLFCRATEKRADLLRDIFLVFCIDILSQAVAPGLAKIPALSGLSSDLYYYRFFQLNKYAPAFFSGVVFAKYDLIAALKDRLCARCVWIDLAVLLALSLGASVLLELFYKYLGKLLRRLSRDRAPAVT